MLITFGMLLAGCGAEKEEDPIQYYEQEPVQESTAIDTPPDTYRIKVEGRGAYDLSKVDVGGTECIILTDNTNDAKMQCHWEDK